MKAAALTAAAFLLAGCGRVFYPEFESQSPDGRHSLAILRNWPERVGGYRYRVELRENGQRRTLFKDNGFKDNGPASIGFVEVNWSRDSGAVRLLLCDGREPVFLGFDLVKVRTLSIDEILPLLRPQIQGRYGLPPETDITTWACGAEGRLAYSRRKQARRGSVPGAVRRNPDRQPDSPAS
jgi:hypothetical protein